MLPGASRFWGVGVAGYTDPLFPNLTFNGKLEIYPFFFFKKFIF